MVEKPPQGTAQSNFIISGRYILSPEIFSILERGEKGSGGEIQLTDGMKTLAHDQKFRGVNFDGQTYDCGSSLGFLGANVAFALARPRYRAGIPRAGQIIVECAAGLKLEFQGRREKTWSM